MKPIDCAVSLTNFLSNRLRDVACVCILFLVFLISTNVIFRYTGIAYWLFVEEWTGYLTVLIAYFMSADALMAGSHVTVNLVTKRISSERVRHILDVITSLVGLALVVYFLIKSTSFMIDAWESRQRSNFPSETLLWIPRSFVPVGLSVLSLALLIRFWGTIRVLMQCKKSKIDTAQEV
ncbi:MAG: TRAP transporter small permease [bacterium]